MVLIFIRKNIHIKTQTEVLNVPIFLILFCFLSSANRLLILFFFCTSVSISGSFSHSSLSICWVSFIFIVSLVVGHLSLFYLLLLTNSLTKAKTFGIAAFTALSTSVWDTLGEMSLPPKSEMIESAKTRIP